jgi:hypothetical protein
MDWFTQLLSGFGGGASGSPAGLPDPTMGGGNLAGTAVPMPQYPSLGTSLGGGSPAGLPMQAPSMPMPTGLPAAPTTAGPAGMPLDISTQGPGGPSPGMKGPGLQQGLGSLQKAFQGVTAPAAPTAQTIRTPPPPHAARPIQGGQLINMLASLGMRPGDLPGVLGAAQRGGFR